MMPYWLDKEFTSEIIELGPPGADVNKSARFLSVRTNCNRMMSALQDLVQSDVWCRCVCSNSVWLAFEQAWSPSCCDLGGKQGHLNLSPNCEQESKVEQTALGSWGYTHILCLNWKQCYCLLLAGRPTNTTTTITKSKTMASCEMPIIGIPSPIRVLKTN